MIRTDWLDVSFLEDPAAFRKEYIWMPASRKEKIDRLRFPEDKRLSLGAGMLLRRALFLAGLSEDADRYLEEGKNGKPYLRGLSDVFQFSLSHSGKIAMIVSAYDAAGNAPFVGCDVEEMKTPELAVAERFFSEEEQKEIFQKEDPEEQKEAFYRFWTLKEAFLKAEGSGLLRPLSSFTVRTSEEGWITVEPAIEGRNVRLFSGDLPGYKAALCVLERI